MMKPAARPPGTRPRGVGSPAVRRVLLNLDPTVGSEIRRTRPCLVVSPDRVNRHIATVIVAPMTTRGRPYPARVACTFEGRDGQVVLDRLRPVDNARLVRRLGHIDRATRENALASLAEMFAE